MDASTRAKISALATQAPIVLFMKGSPQFPQCGFSARACAILSQLGAEFAHVDILADDEVRRGAKEFSNWPTFPQLYARGEFLGGADIMAEMLASGELAACLGDSAQRRQH